MLGRMGNGKEGIENKGTASASLENEVAICPETGNSHWLFDFFSPIARAAVHLARSTLPNTVK